MSVDALWVQFWMWSRIQEVFAKYRSEQMGSRAFNQPRFFSFLTFFFGEGGGREKEPKGEQTCFCNAQVQGVKIWN